MKKKKHNITALKKLWAISTFTLLVYGCILEKRCPDLIDPDFPARNLEWFSYQIGDTLLFKDAETKDTLHLICTSRLTGYDSIFNYDYQCKHDDGWYQIHPYLTNEFVSDLPFFYSGGVDMSSEMYSSPSSNLHLTFGEPNSALVDGYRFWFNSIENKIALFDPNSWWPANIAHLDSITINNIEYQNVFIISKESHPDGGRNVYYDTIYYNKDGFLKFISSQYGYRLERLP